MNDNEFETFLNNAVDRTEAKNVQLMNNFEIGLQDRFYYDLPKGTIIFSKKTGLLFKKLEPTLIADIIPVGTHVDKHDSFQWGWAADTFPEEIVSKSKKLIALASITNLQAFEKPKFECDKIMAWEIACMACEHLQGQGVYRAPTGQVMLYLILENIRPYK